MTPAANKPREWWIEFGEECDPFVMNNKPMFPSDAIHVVEYSAYAAVTQQLKVCEADCVELIKERDHREEQINQIADVLGDSSEWSNVSDRGDNAIELASDLRDRVRELEAERDAWKSEYDNVCKFANAYETQRDRYRAVAEKLEHIIRRHMAVYNAKGFNEVREALAEYEAMKK